MWAGPMEAWLQLEQPQTNRSPPSVTTWQETVAGLEVTFEEEAERGVIDYQVTIPLLSGIFFELN